MIAPSPAIGAIRNCSATYLQLGRNTPGSEIVEDECFTACVGPVDHPICNFAVDVAATYDSAERLAAHGSGRPVFNVYLGSTETAGQQAMAAAGFKRVYELHQMTAGSIAGRQVDGFRIVQSHERARIASFMVGEFFANLPSSVRATVGRATAAADALALCGLFHAGALVGAAMLHDAHGHLGLYNLCVSAPNRGQGFGAAIVSAIVALAQDRDRPVCLQCDVGLVDWYRALGFEPSGTITVHALAKSASGVIMK